MATEAPRQQSPRAVLPRVGWSLVSLLLVLFVWGVVRRARQQEGGEAVIRMLFVPSVEQGTLARRGSELAAFVRKDAGLVVKPAVPTSYAAVVQALGAGQADIAWVPAFAYVIANARHGAEARLQVVREAERHAILVTRAGASEPSAPEGLADKAVAVPRSLSAGVRGALVAGLDAAAPGWREVRVDTDAAAVKLLLDDPSVAAAASGHVFSGPRDFVGDGRKELEAERPGTLDRTRVVWKTREPVKEHVFAYYGAVYTRSDSGIRRLEDLSGKPFAFSDVTSTSGYLFPFTLLARREVKLGHVYFAGGHANVVQAVSDGKVAAGSSFYSFPGRSNELDHTFVNDARLLLLKRREGDEARLAFLDEVRIVALTDPIPNDVCCVRRGFPRPLWDRFERSLQRFLATPDGQKAYFDLVAAVAARSCDDGSFDGFRGALRASGVSAAAILDAEEARLKKKREEKKGGGK